VTGRKLDTITKFVQSDKLFFAGSHGFDIIAPGGKPLAAVGEEFLPMLNSTCTSLAESMKAFPGAEVEDNKFSFSVHYRNAEQSKKDEIEQIVDAALAEHGDKLKKTHGKMVFEIRPNFDWDKGHAVAAVFERVAKEHNASQDDYVALYIGDDRTDEDAFDMLEKNGHGFGIRVQTIENLAPTRMFDDCRILDVHVLLAKGGGGG
jgi:trehalose 6-phosphate phosphatase